MRPAVLMLSTGKQFLQKLRTSKCTVHCVTYRNYAKSHSILTCISSLQRWTAKKTTLLDCLLKQGWRTTTVGLPVSGYQTNVAFYCTSSKESKTSCLSTQSSDVPIEEHDEQHQDHMGKRKDSSDGNSVSENEVADTSISEYQFTKCSHDHTSNGHELSNSETNLTLKSEADPGSVPTPSEELSGAPGTTNSSSVPPENDTTTSVTAVLDFVDIPATQTPADGQLELEDVDPSPVDTRQPYSGPVRRTYLGLRHLVDYSETLQKLVHLGVDLHKLSKKRNAANLIAKLDFDSQVKEKLMFLLHIGVAKEDLGNVISVNPFILGVDYDRLEKRVEYLRSKKFKEDEIGMIVSRAPYLLQFSVQRVDNKLGWLQRNLLTTAAQTRHIVVRYPQVLTVSLATIKENLQVAQLQLGFSTEELRTMAVKAPRMLSRNKYKLITVFDYLHNEMGLPHHIIARSPQVFNSRQSHLAERHQFLQKLGRAQYDPDRPGYIPLEKFFTLPDAIFCTQLAKVTLEDYQNFLKTL